MKPSEKLESLQIKLPPAPRPVAAYVPGVLVDGWVYISGQLPMVEGELQYQGKVGLDITAEQGFAAARICALNCLAVAADLTGSIDRVERVVKVTGFVNSARGFTGQPSVINGASEFLGHVFGPAGAHARAAVGVNELPLNAAVEIEMVLKIR
ncbi:Enamine deaminase RidA, house cleaning of reactive enamine intermediates, YjgF/YER057c/UK114 family [Desulfotomaculum arcticum]|uniref:Enamine deaminase RidA, house cleaning of reactive enamine intermediates, YjgF/YER057c/UK114 family n=1 Tax=Desulfotruncus arcticus DSM 17038 TaxID=1121424 RepID=A0A1I2UNM8_9FIRM|nr:RidA family protein [Desulfotruncus arcticus]SFG76381.1 Enamine deaminase RidA, house cleaning of reactive enamine intermediates, YjgF/YER057c/UK114 family [Desulfotomaculum arcticum] [Desulfotruncus arcticus DSM 17038]